MPFSAAIRNACPVVLAEDNPDDADFVRRAFRRLGIEPLLTVAADGAAAMSTIEALWDTRIALILLDLKMPKLSGLEVLEQLRERRLGSLPAVVVFTSSDEDRDVTRAYELGANAYVCKPVDMLAYNETLERMIRFWLADNRLVIPLSSRSKNGSVTAP